MTTLRQDLAVVADMLHIAAYAQHGGVGGAYNVLDAFPRNLLPLLLKCCTCSLMLNRGGGGLITYLTS